MSNARRLLVPLDTFDYYLPESLIAKYPLEERDASRMLVLDKTNTTITDAQFTQLGDYLAPGDVLVLNNAKVSPVRMMGKREGFPGKVEIFLLHPQDAAQTEWLALIRPAKKLKEGTVVVFENSDLTVTILERLITGKARVKLNWPEDMDFQTVLHQVGQMPLPPYLSRDAEASDKHRYQTVFAKTPGAQAAPTAGLHFTEQTLTDLTQKGIVIAELTLYVSAGTFRPVTSENALEHKMDAEAYELNEEAVQKIQAAQKSGNKVVAVGTTAAKTLETVATKYNGELKADTGWSELFITPGFKFQIIDALLTNFHLPKSTLLMLVSAFAQDHDFMMKAYKHAIAGEYRFYSYGDCMLII